MSQSFIPADLQQRAEVAASDREWLTRLALAAAVIISGEPMPRVIFEQQVRQVLRPGPQDAP